MDEKDERIDRVLAILPRRSVNRVLSLRRAAEDALGEILWILLRQDQLSFAPLMDQGAFTDLATLVREMANSSFAYEAADVLALFRHLQAINTPAYIFGEDATLQGWPEVLDQLVQRVVENSAAVLRAGVDGLRSPYNEGIQTALLRVGALSPKQVSPKTASAVLDASRLLFHGKDHKAARELLWSAESFQQQLLARSEELEFAGDEAVVAMTKELPTSVVFRTVYNLSSEKMWAVTRAVSRALWQMPEAEEEGALLLDRMSKQPDERTPRRLLYFFFAPAAFRADEGKEPYAETYDSLFLEVLQGELQALATNDRYINDNDLRLILAKLPVQRSTRLLLKGAGQHSATIKRNQLRAGVLRLFVAVPTEEVLAGILAAMSLWTPTEVNELLPIATESFVELGESVLPALDAAGSKYPNARTMYRGIARRIEALA